MIAQQNKSFIKQERGDDLTDGMVEFVRDIIQTRSKNGIRYQYLEVLQLYTLSDKGFMSAQHKKTSPGLEEAHLQLERMKFWQEQYNQRTPNATAGLYYALALLGENTLPDILEKLKPGMIELDKKLENRPAVGNDLNKKMAALYGSFLINSIDASEEDKNFALDGLLVESAIAEKGKYKMRDAHTYARGMCMLMESVGAGYKEGDDPVASKLFKQNAETAQAKGYVNITEILDDMAAKMLVFGSYEKAQKYLM